MRARLARETSTGLFIPEVDGLRFVAILSVFVFHLNAYLQSHSLVRYKVDGLSPILCRLLSEGRFGVQLFFVISGLILSLPFAARHLQNKAPVSLKAYFLRRIARIEPPYIINMLLAFGLLIFLTKGPLRSFFLILAPVWDMLTTSPLAIPVS